MNLRDLDLRKLNSATKYPSIPTYHTLGERGRLRDEVLTPLTGELSVSEKIDGTNTRAILFRDELFIGSREEFLTYGTDVVRNPALGIVDAVLPIAQRLHGRFDAPAVIYGEVFGGNINNAKAYTKTKTCDFRVFDVVRFDSFEALERVLEMPGEQIARWRDAGKQPFVDDGARAQLVGDLGLRAVPQLEARASEVPTELAATLEWMRSIVGDRTHASIDGEAGKPEGVVVRSRDRGVIAKLRFEDYARSLR